jgi:hypothetical protein
MVRSALIGLTVLVAPAVSFAQVSTGRVLRDAVILEQPRGDSRVLATVPPGIVLELLAIQGDWYSVPVPPPAGTTERTGATGWINRAAVEPMPGRVPQEAGAAPVVSPTPSSRWFSFRQGIRPRSTEMSFHGALTTTNYGNDVSTTTFEVGGFGGYFATPNLEIGVLGNLLKVTGAGVIGQIGPAAAFNIAPERPFNGFVGGSLGWGFGLAPINPTYFEVFGGIRAMVPGGGGAFIVRPFWQHDSYSMEESVNLYGISFGVSIFF